MPRKSGGAQNLRRGDRVRILLNGSYRHFLNGLTGRVTQVLHHGVIVALDNDPVRQQRVIAPAVGRHKDQTQGISGPKVPTLAQRQFQFHEVEKLNP